MVLKNRKRGFYLALRVVKCSFQKSDFSGLVQSRAVEMLRYFENKRLFCTG